MAIKSARVSYDIVGARVVGSRHVAQGLPCQDYFVSDEGPDWAVAVISDGAGSVPRALDGARYAAAEICSTVSAKVRENVSRYLIRRLASQWLSRPINWHNPSMRQEILSDLRSAVLEGIERARARCLLEAADGQRWPAAR
jgi:Protein phosphatase 2C